MGNLNLNIEELPEDIKNNIDERISKYIDLIDEYSNYDDNFLYTEMERARRLSDQEPGKGAEIYFAAREVIKIRSKNKQKHIIFSHNETPVLFVFSCIVTICTVATLILSLLSYFEIKND